MNLLVNLDVDDLEKAVRFYSSVFGLNVGRRFGAFGVEMLGSSAPSLDRGSNFGLKMIEQRTAPYGTLLLRLTVGSLFIAHLYWKFAILPGVRDEDCRATLGSASAGPEDLGAGRTTKGAPDGSR